MDFTFNLNETELVRIALFEWCISNIIYNKKAAKCRFEKDALTTGFRSFSYLVPSCCPTFGHVALFWFQ